MPAYVDNYPTLCMPFIPDRVEKNRRSKGGPGTIRCSGELFYVQQAIWCRGCARDGKAGRMTIMADVPGTRRLPPDSLVGLMLIVAGALADGCGGEIGDGSA